ncbi:MAG: discoidin domain-containing protein, partial [Saprospiraceae bacterium]
MCRTFVLPARIIFASFAILASCKLLAQWDPYAGVVASYTDVAQLGVSAPGFNELANIIDGDNNTAWQSTNPLPSNYAARPDQNVLLGKGNEWCAASTAADFSLLTDSNFDSHVDIGMASGKAWLEFTFPAAQPMLLFNFKAQVSPAISVFVYPEGQDSLLLGNYTSADNYSFKRFDFSGLTAKIRLEATAPFIIFEAAMLAEPPKEFVILDFGEIRDVGRITTRHWAGIDAASATALYISQDSMTWEHVASLNPVAIGPVTTFLSPSRPARYLKVEHTLFPVNYKKANFWEVDAYDRDGPYGPMPPPQPSAVTVRQLLGINGIWGWGHNMHSIDLPPGQGPQLYNRFAANGRNYHFWGWDVTDPDTIPDFESMAAGNGTQAKGWLNWDNEYAAWQNAGLEVDCTIQMGDWDESDFDDAYAAGFNYAKAFAAHFGPTPGNGQVSIMEAGNEPWHLDSLFYRSLLQGMAEGAKAGDPAVKMLPCALQAAFPQNEKTTASRNYMGARITEDIAPLLDGLNLHLYSFAFDGNGIRIAVQPEHPASGMRALFNALRWRDFNMPATPIYLTEWGWDHDGAGEDCTHSECVTETEAVAYFTRGALMLLRTQVQRADIYFYANTDGASSLFARSGATGSLATDFEKKKSFLALESLVHTLGDKYFLSAIREDS